MCLEKNATTNTVIVDKTHAVTLTITDSESDNKVDHEQKRRRIVELSPLDKGASRFLDYMIDGFVKDSQDYSDGNEERIDAENA